MKTGDIATELDRAFAAARRSVLMGGLASAAANSRPVLGLSGPKRTSARQYAAAQIAKTLAENHETVPGQSV